MKRLRDLDIHVVSQLLPDTRGSMGRREYGDTTGGDSVLIPIDKQGYDPNGAYWGVSGQPLICHYRLSDGVVVSRRFTRS
jgi:hypothetical protein